MRGIQQGRGACLVEEQRDSMWMGLGDVDRTASGRAARRTRSGSNLGLARTAARPLARHDDALDEELAAPDTPRLPTLEGAGEAGGADGAVGAQGLGVLDVSRRLGEEQLRVEGPARQQRTELVDLGVPGFSRIRVEQRSSVSPPNVTSELAGVRNGQTERPRIPLRGFRGLEGSRSWVSDRRTPGADCAHRR